MRIQPAPKLSPNPFVFIFTLINSDLGFHVRGERGRQKFYFETVLRKLANKKKRLLRSLKFLQTPHLNLQIGSRTENLAIF